MGNIRVEHVMFLTGHLRRDEDCPGASTATSGPVLLRRCRPFLNLKHCLNGIGRRWRARDWLAGKTSDDADLRAAWQRQE